MGRASSPAPIARIMNEFIDLRGARETTPKDISLRVAKRQITIFTGVSGLTIACRHTIVRPRTRGASAPIAAA